jgi:hypothetical protein
MYHFPFFLSKTPSWQVAAFFARQSGNRFYQKFMVCRYPSAGSRHICLDMRTNFNDEYEYLAYGETFKLVEKVYHFGLLPCPSLRVYYVLEFVE